ncbi:hypothetical protein KG089_05260 [Carnobacteriaceae bacterium zg-ZUI252]|nr:hypothetical protein [Carnobacteriaceae bacterium zg-ZUI252]
MKISRSKLAELEELFLEYRTYDKKIALRKAELQIKERDENVGAGKTLNVSKVVENTVIKEMSDFHLQYLIRCKDAVNYTVDYFKHNPMIAKVIKIKFFEFNGIKKWDEVAEECHVSQATIYRIRYWILEVFGNRLGTVNTIDLK